MIDKYGSRKSIHEDYLLFFRPSWILIFATVYIYFRIYFIHSIRLSLPKRK